MKWMIIIIILAVVIGVVYLGFGSGLQSLFGPKKPEQITLTYWGTQEDQAYLQPVFDGYHQLHPNVTINYSKQSTINYRTRVQTQLRNGQGPDILDIHSSWLPMFTSDLAIAPSTVLSLDQYSKTFYPIAKDKLTIGSKVYAVPLELDGLVLYYNQDLLKFANAGIPATWPDLISGALKVRVPPKGDPIQTAGVAMGTTNNVDFWPEILGTLFLQQPDADITQPDNKSGQDVLVFYTQFAQDPDKKVWDSTLPSSTQMFINGKLAYYIAPSKMARQIIQANPSLNFRTSPVPQLPGKQVSWGTFWASGVSVRSKHQAQAWDFLNYLTSTDALKQINQARVAAKQLPIVYPRVDLASDQVNDPILGAVVKQGNFYQSWYLNSDTSDDGINDEMVKVYEQALSDYLSHNNSVDNVLSDAASGIQGVLAKYLTTQTTR